MILRKLSQSFKVVMALMVATFSSGLLAPAASVGALSTSPNNDCSAGLVFLEKYNWNPGTGTYALDTDSDGTSVSVAGNAEAGTFSTSGANVIVKEVHLKGGQATDTDFYPSGTTSGSFNNSQLTSVNGSGKTITHEISNVQFCGTVTPTGSLNVGVDCEEVTFSAGAVTPAGGTVTFTLDGIAKVAGTYTVTPGDHTVVMSVNGTVVDTEVRTIAECEQVIPPAGQLTVSVGCEEGTFSGVVTAPEGGTATYKVNGNLTVPGTYTGLTPGSYTVEMYVNGTLVDSETVVVEACEEEPPVPAGTLTVNVTCEAGSFSGTVTAPEGGTATYKVNGNVTAPGNYTGLTPGSYTVEMFVNGTLVDSETVVVESCDVCPNITGTQTSVPSGMKLDNQGNCVDKKIEICHATSAVKNAYNKIEVSVNAADGVAGNSGAQPDHYGEHTGAIFNPATDVNGGNWGDIIPPIEGVHSGLNWTEQGQAIYNNGDCETVLPATPKAPKFKDFCGEKYDSLYIPYTEGVKYYVNGQQASSGWMKAPSSEVTVTAVAKSGYVLTTGSTTKWEHEYTDENCLTITKSANLLTDTNKDGVIGVGDKVTWTITVTNNGTKLFERFDVVVTDEGAVIENDGVIEGLTPGESVTLEAHTFITAADISTVCKVTNTASFEATYSRYELLTETREETIIIDEQPKVDFSGRVNAEALFNCPTPGRGGDTPTTPGQTLGTSTTTVAAAALPATLPATGGEQNPLMIILASILAYGAAYFIQGRRNLARNQA